MRLITELNEDVGITEVIEESTGKKALCIEGIFLQGGIKNRNGRVYPHAILENEVGRYIQEKVNTQRAVGELGHPNGPQINLDRISHKIVSLSPDGKGNYIGKAIVTEGTQQGANLKGLLEAGIKLGVSSRGLGSLRNRNGIMEVCEDFHLATAADVVADPSAPDAFVNGIMEGVEWICKNGVWQQQQLDEARMALDRVYRDKAEFEKLGMKLFENFISKL
ncbi:prohead core scaffold and protease [Stenotrophomonas phage vB_SmaS-DLP_6]|nr:prohead core scaffold and protease [Stenotrophomonas phage vB_SmaS-DLP_6]